jgi:hypothetical protein
MQLTTAVLEVYDHGFELAGVQQPDRACDIGADLR